MSYILLETKKILLPIFLWLILTPVMAVPVSQEKSQLLSSNDVFHVADSYSIAHLFEESKQVYKVDNISLILEVIESDFLLPDIQDIEEQTYSEYRKKADNNSKYAVLENNFKSNLFKKTSTSSQSSSALWVLLEPLKDEVYLKENMLEVLDSIRNVRDLLISSSEITYENSEEDTSSLINEHIVKEGKRNEQLILEKQAPLNSEKKEQQTTSPLKAFFIKIKSLLNYILIGVCLIATLWFFINFQKIIQYFSKNSVKTKKEVVPNSKQTPFRKKSSKKKRRRRERRIHPRRIRDRDSKAVDDKTKYKKDRRVHNRRRSDRSKIW